MSQQKEHTTVSDDKRDELVKIAKQMMEKAYAPYSKFLVGSALLGDDGVIYTGVNVENQSYGLTICAERTSACKMVSEGCQQIQAIAVSTSIGASPCGACRQVLAEFANKNNFPVYLNNATTGETLTTSMRELLPQPVDLFWLKNQ
jgi:cytidine deaminase